jgi:hypothetical protein
MLHYPSNKLSSVSDIIAFEQNIPNNPLRNATQWLLGYKSINYVYKIMLLIHPIAVTGRIAVVFSIVGPATQTVL